MRLFIALVLWVPVVASAAPPQAGAESGSSSVPQLRQGVSAHPAPRAPRTPQGAQSLSKPVAPEVGSPQATPKVQPGARPTLPEPRMRVPIGGSAHPGLSTPQAGQRPNASPSLRGVPAPQPVEELHSVNESATADLQIVEIKRIVSGSNRGRVAILVRAVPTEAGKRPPQKSFPVRLERRDRVVWRGRGHVKNLLIGWGDQVVTSYVLGSSQVTLRAVINARTTSLLYPEAWPETLNSMEQTFNAPRGATGGTARSAQSAIDRTGEGDFVTQLRGASVLREGADWQVIRFNYDLNRRDSARGHNDFGVQFVTNATADWDSVYCNSVRPESHFGAVAKPGRGRIEEVLCRLGGGRAGPVRGHVRAYLSYRDGDRMVSRRQIDLRDKDWSHQEDDPVVLPDFSITRAVITYGRAGPRDVEVHIRNEAGFPLPSVSLEAAFVDRIDGTVATRTYEVLLHGEEGSALLSIASGDDFEWVMGDRNHLTGFLELTVNRRGHVVEANTDNNERRISVADYTPRAH